MIKLYKIIQIMLVLFMASTFISAQNSDTSKKKKDPDADFKNKTVDELAKDLANPNTPLTSLKFKTQFRAYTGELNGASSENGSLTLLQPTLPFPFKNGNKLWVRPGIPYYFNQPSYNGTEFISNSGLGDIVIDFQYGGTLKSGILWSVGATTTMPTATKSELGINQWAVGPGFQLGYVSKKAVLGWFINHQFGLGSDPQDFSLTTLQVFAVFLPAGGWNVGSAPIITYNYELDSWAVPLNIAFGKTIKINDRPWKFAIELNYYVKQNSQFGPEWMLGINIAPGVENVIANWL